jgi:glycosyltransferase involved in cell wall biosynthesis
VKLFSAQDIKISLITVTFNAESTIEQCIKSVIGQTYKNVEYIIIDGASTDNTIQIINNFENYIHHFLSEPDKGIYDAMNKGIALATGQVIGMLNADDVFADENVLSLVAEAFAKHEAEIIYGDLDFVDQAGAITRKWRSGKYLKGMFSWGWMPPHPTFYCKKNLFNQFGFYSLNFGTAADYELMLRFMHLNHIDAYYIQKVIIKMKIGGISNKSFRNRVKGLLCDFKAMQNNGISFPIITIFFKPLRKIQQYF